MTYDPCRDTYTIGGQELAADPNKGAFLRALRHEMEQTMNEYNTCHIIPTLTPSVKSAKKQLKEAKAEAKLQRKAAKAARRAEEQRQLSHDIAVEALRDVAQDDRKYSADARVAAAHELLQLELTR